VGSRFPPTGESSYWYVRGVRRGRGEKRHVRRCQPTLHKCHPSRRRV
jgi:hypothetical protein